MMEIILQEVQKNDGDHLKRSLRKKGLPKLKNSIFNGLNPTQLAPNSFFNPLILICSFQILQNTPKTLLSQKVNPPSLPNLEESQEHYFMKNCSMKQRHRFELNFKGKSFWILIIWL